MAAAPTPRPQADSTAAASPAHGQAWGGQPAPPPADLGTWTESISQAVVPLDIEATGGVEFSGQLLQATVEDVALFELATTPHIVHRTAAHISDEDARFYKISLQLSGQAILEQDGRTATLRPGDLAIYDTHRPYRLHFPEPNRALVVLFPHELSDLPPDEVAKVTATAFAHDEGLGRIINPFFRELARNMDQLAGTHAARLVHSGLDLLMTMLSQELHRQHGTVGDPARSLAQEVREYIIARLGDEDLTPAAIAKAHYISLRHLYTIFSNQETTVSAWIRSRRLEHIRRDLTDPLLADQTVLAIASRWGLRDASHFSRVFKAEFGTSPTAYRRAHLPLLNEAG